MAVMPDLTCGFSNLGSNTYPDFYPPNVLGPDSGLAPGNNCATGAAVQSVAQAFVRDTSKVRWNGAVASAKLHCPPNAQYGSDCVHTRVIAYIEPNQAAKSGDTEFWCFSFWYPTGMQTGVQYHNVLEWSPKEYLKWPSNGMIFCNLNDNDFSIVFHTGQEVSSTDPTILPAPAGYSVTEPLLGPSAVRPMTKDTWHDWIVEVVWSSGRAGRVTPRWVMYHREGAGSWEKIYSNQNDGTALINRPVHPTLMWNTTYGEVGDNAGDHGMIIGNMGMYRNYNSGTQPLTEYWMMGAARRGSVSSAQALFSGGSASAMPANISQPTITGAATQGALLTGGNGTWSGNPTSLTYQWRRNGVDIAAATGQTYRLAAADVGTAITFVVTATNTFGSATATSAPTGAIAATPAYVWRQWVDGFNGTTIEAGTSVTINAVGTNEQKNRITATIPNGDDTQDTAIGFVNASRMPTGSEGRMRIYFHTPSTFNLVANSTIIKLVNAAGASILDVYLTASEQIGLFSQAGTLSSGSLNAVGSASLVPNTDHVIEVAWRQNSVRKLWLDGTLIVNSTGLAGATAGGAVPNVLNIGIDHYDALAVDPGWSSSLYFGQLTDNADVELFDPVFGNAVQVTVAGGFFVSPAVKRRYRTARAVSLVFNNVIRRKIGTRLLSALVMTTGRKVTFPRKVAAAFTLVPTRRFKAKLARNVTLTIMPTVRRSKYGTSLAATLTDTATMVKVSKRKRLSAVVLTLGNSFSIQLTTPGRALTFSLSLPVIPLQALKQSRFATLAASPTITAALRKTVKLPKAATLAFGLTSGRRLSSRRSVSASGTMTPTLSRRASLRRSMTRTMTLTPAVARPVKSKQAMSRILNVRPNIVKFIPRHLIVVMPTNALVQLATTGKMFFAPVVTFAASNTRVFTRKMARPVSLLLTIGQSADARANVLQRATSPIAAVQTRRLLRGRVFAVAPIFTATADFVAIVNRKTSSAATLVSTKLRGTD